MEWFVKSVKSVMRRDDLRRKVTMDENVTGGGCVAKC